MIRFISYIFLNINKWGGGRGHGGLHLGVHFKKKIDCRGGGVYFGLKSREKVNIAPDQCLPIWEIFPNKLYLCAGVTFRCSESKSIEIFNNYCRTVPKRNIKKFNYVQLRKKFVGENLSPESYYAILENFKTFRQ